MKEQIKIGFVKLPDGRFKGTYQVTAHGKQFETRKTYGLFADAEAAKVGAKIDADIAIAHGIFMLSVEDRQQQRFQESVKRRAREAQDLKDHIKCEVKKKLMRLAHSM